MNGGDKRFHTLASLIPVPVFLATVSQQVT